MLNLIELLEVRDRLCCEEEAATKPLGRCEARAEREERSEEGGSERPSLEPGESE